MRTVDLRGVGCPTNFVKAKLALEMADPGEVIGFLLDEGEPVENVLASLKGEGHRLLGREDLQGYCSLTVERGED